MWAFDLLECTKLHGVYDNNCTLVIFKLGGISELIYERIVAQNQIWLRECLREKLELYKFFFEQN